MILLFYSLRLILIYGLFLLLTVVPDMRCFSISPNAYLRIFDSVWSAVLQFSSASCLMLEGEFLSLEML